MLRSWCSISSNLSKTELQLFIKSICPCYWQYSTVGWRTLKVKIVSSQDVSKIAYIFNIFRNELVAIWPSPYSNPLSTHSKIVFVDGSFHAFWSLPSALPLHLLTRVLLKEVRSYPFGPGLLSPSKHLFSYFALPFGYEYAFTLISIAIL